MQKRLAAMKGTETIIRANNFARVAACRFALGNRMMCGMVENAKIFVANPVLEHLDE